jgi:Tol biopolymer transport system component
VIRTTFAVALGAIVAAAAALGASTPSFRSCGGVVGGEAVVASDGSIVYASHVGTYELKSIRPDGARASTLLKSERVVGNPSVSPDGRLVAFDRGTNNEVWVMNRDGSNAHFLTNGTTPSFSPDGTRLAVGGAQTAFNRYELDLVNLDGNGRHAVASDAAPFPHPSWSPDGKQIAFVSFTREQMDFSSIRRVGSDGNGETGVRIFGADPRWSPDGKWISYTANGDRSLPTEVHVVRPDGGADRRISRLKGLDAFAATWSPNGQRLVFNAQAAGTESSSQLGGAFWTVEATGRGMHPLGPGCRFGTGERDRIHGTNRSDRIYALEGNDTVDVRGGGRDFVDCGPGHDTVSADRRDIVARDCEHVRRVHRRQ